MAPRDSVPPSSAGSLFSIRWDFSRTLTRGAICRENVQDNGKATLARASGFYVFTSRRSQWEGHRPLPSIVHVLPPGVASGRKEEELYLSFYMHDIHSERNFLSGKNPHPETETVPSYGQIKRINKKLEKKKPVFFYLKMYCACVMSCVCVSDSLVVLPLMLLCLSPDKQAIGGGGDTLVNVHHRWQGRCNDVLSCLLTLFSCFREEASCFLSP